MELSVFEAVDLSFGAEVEIGLLAVLAVGSCLTFLGGRASTLMQDCM